MDSVFDTSALKHLQTKRSHAVLNYFTLPQNKLINYLFKRKLTSVVCLLILASASYSPSSFASSIFEPFSDPKRLQTVDTLESLEIVGNVDLEKDTKIYNVYLHANAQEQEDSFVMDLRGFTLSMVANTGDDYDGGKNQNNLVLTEYSPPLTATSKKRLEVKNGTLEIINTNVSQNETQNESYAINADNSSLTLENVNLKLISQNGLAGYADYAHFIITGGDYIDITVNQGKTEHHGITTFVASYFDISANLVDIKASGETDKKGEACSILQNNGGKIVVKGNSVSLINNVHNKQHYNYGIYSVGIDAYYRETAQVYVSSLQKQSSQLTVSSTNSDIYNFGVYNYSKEKFSEIKIYDFEKVSISAGEYSFASYGWYYDAETCVFDNDEVEIRSNRDGIFNSARGNSDSEHPVKSVVNIHQNDYVDLEVSRWGINSYAQNVSTASVSIDSRSISFKAGDTGIYNTSAIDSASEVKLHGEIINFVAPFAVYNPSGGQNLVSITATNSLEINSSGGYISVTFGPNSSTHINHQSPGKTVLYGSVLSFEQAVTYLDLNTKDSFWKGASQDYRLFGKEAEGRIEVTAKEGATWRVLDVDVEDGGPNGEIHSYITTWNSLNNSVVDLTEQDHYQLVNIHTLKGTGTTFNLATDVNADRGVGKSTDQVVIHSGSGAHKIFVKSTGTQPWTKAQKDFLVAHYEENGATSVPIAPPVEEESSSSENASSSDSSVVASAIMAMNDAADSQSEPLSHVLANPKQRVDVGLYSYVLATRPHIDENGEEKGTEWYLTRIETPEDPPPPPPPDDPDPDVPLSPEGQVVTALSGIGGRALIWHAQLQDLRKRLGEVRYGAQDGLWARVIWEKDRADGTAQYGFEQKWYGLNIGLDHIVKQNEDNMFLLGGNFKYGRATQKVGGGRVGDGKLNAYGAYLYATWANHYGCYSDFVLSLDKYKQKLNATLSDYTRAHGQYNSWGWGASIEIGKMFSSRQNDEDWGPWHNHWWIEPQLQLSYYWLKGKDFAMNNGMTVSQSNGQSLVGRAGLVIGKQFKYGSDKASLDQRYSQFYIKGGVKHEFLGKQDAVINNVKFDNRLRGTSVYYGLGFDWNATKNLRLYAQAERESGGKYKKDYEVSIGLKYQF